MLAAYFVVAALRPQRGEAAWGPLRRTMLVVVLAAIAAALSPAFGTNVFSPSSLARERARSHLRWKEALAGLNDLPAGSVVASDPVTSYVITAFTPHKVVCTLDQHAPTGDLRGRERTIAARDILSPFTSASDKAHQMAAHGVTHVLVNDELGPLPPLDYWTVSQTSAPLVTARLDELDGLFPEAETIGGLRLYRAGGSTPRHVTTIRNPLLRRSAPPSAAPVGEAAGLAWLEAAGIVASDSVSPGGSIDVTLYWRREDSLPLDKYFVTIRFNSVDVHLPLGGRPFPKVARKLKEAIDGVRYRFRQDHTIVDGFLSPDAWPPGLLVVDRTNVSIPVDVATGRYAVSAKLHTRVTSPNHHVRDFFYDDDVYEGVVIGEITIGRKK